MSVVTMRTTQTSPLPAAPPVTRIIVEGDGTLPDAVFGGPSYVGHYIRQAGLKSAYRAWCPFELAAEAEYTGEPIVVTART